MVARHVSKAPPVHACEASGLRFLAASLPDDYVVYSNLELPTGRAGQTYEHDAVVVAPHAVFTVELKCWGGRVRGNRDRWALDSGTVVQSPLPLVLAKARSLKGRLVARRYELSGVWVQGLVFLSLPDAAPQITEDFEDLVVTRRDVIRTLTDPSWLNLHGRLSQGQHNAVLQVLDDGEPQRPPSRFGDFQLVERLPSDDRPYDAWLAEAALTGERRVLHAYTLGAGAGSERDRIRAQALREATLHSRLMGGPDILRYHAYFVTQDAPERIVLQFEDTTPLVPAGAWTRDRTPGLEPRLRVAARTARALAFVHDKKLVHRRLSLDTILVSPEDRPTEVRLCAFDLARDLTGAAPTITGGSLGTAALRTAPEVLRTGEATPRSDLFSLGATLFELFTGRPLFQSPDEILGHYECPAVHVGERPVPPGVSALLARLLSPDPADRPTDADEVADELQQAAESDSAPPAYPELKPGAVLRDTYELERRLGRGATGATWLATQLQTGQKRVLKIADTIHAPILQEEARILDVVHHPNLVRSFNLEPLPTGNMLVFGYVDGVTATVWAGAGDPLDAAAILRVARGLFGALNALHTEGYVHRDVKPDNLMLSEPDAEPTLLDVGLARPMGAAGDLAVGTLTYKDPLIYAENAWSPANDQYAAMLTLYELLTGIHPFGTDAPDADRAAAIDADQLPDTLKPATARRLAAVFEKALSPTRPERPANLSDALAALEVALSDVDSAVIPATTGPALPADATPDSPTDGLGLSTRSYGALARLGVEHVAGLAGLTRPGLQSLRNVGRKTVAELLTMADAVRARWPELTTAADTRLPEPLRLFPPLATDPRPLSALGPGLSARLHTRLHERGIHTIGELCSLATISVTAIPGVGPSKVDKLVQALRRLAGLDEGPSSLHAIDQALRRELKARYEPLASVMGFHAEQPMGIADAAESLGLTRQRISQATDLSRLRAPGAATHTLTRHLEQALPTAGFMTLEAAAQALKQRLAVADGDPPLVGYARLASLLLRPDGRAALAPTVRYACRAPLDEELIDGLLRTLSAAVSWPPRPRAEVADALWESAGERTQRTLVRFGASAEVLLDAVLRLYPDARSDPAGNLYVPPVRLTDALRFLRPTLDATLDAPALLAAADAAFVGLLVPEDPTPEILAAGYRKDGDRFADPARVDPPTEAVVPKVDPSIPRQRVTDDAPPVVEALIAGAAAGGVRVVALPPHSHHDLSHRLYSWLVARLGADRVRYLHTDRVLVEALQATEYWSWVPHFEARGDADWSWAEPVLTQALETALTAGTPGLVTVVAQPSLLGPLGLMHWLSGFYERARGGRHGLVVLAMPGGIHDNRVRLNERYNLPYTPDMAAVYLDPGSPH